ncbi:cell division control protein Cdc5 [Schizosaccharomyces japonicus yFS275]|uniref:Cell division control protein Cdc5 n=1 Tax=Schizosaccharomyces japonicus (strain yFS275 / FY16936) TaxID=402676 RepID=B6JXU5_SCHJY|nr:cell division control protein Cdc5 [Schizosaccharomyces japonicus yFS275]EEB06363.2 cell division control protein Cdc5 [Schizosaccharomyces japonicus yFS275]
MSLSKGGYWKNTEDEILKAAVSKYGKNQWARISSLLVRKTPKQCKARWYEWIDPSIKKTEWSREEDEKLLHLAKLLPTQWRTIAPIVGRTATQCLERYQKLLDDLEAKENAQLGLTSGEGAEAAAPADDPNSRLRFGSAEPNLETLPALPDAIDMDEDEKEMLSEARARLANTQGKKAKRKDREKQLELTRRLAQLQKRRELKAAGINIKLFQRKKNEMDYNAAIPFEKKPALGFYDVSEEERANLREKRDIDVKLLEEGKRRQDDSKQQKKRLERAKPAAGLRTMNKDAHEEKMRRLAEAQQMSKRRKLSLPAPQVSESELKDVVKQGMAGDRAQTMATVTRPATTYSENMMGRYTQLERSASLRTPRAGELEGTEDTITVEAKNLLIRSREQSSLLGGENVPLQQGGTGYSSVTPVRTEVTRTPQTTEKQITMLQATPVRTATAVYKTPRDTLALNQKTRSEKAIEEVKLRKFRLQELKTAFATLPKPKNDYELMEPQFAEENDVVSTDAVGIEDAGEREKRLLEQKEKEHELALQRRTQVVQRDLPRPHIIRVDAIIKANTVVDENQKTVFDETIKLVISDAKRYPQENTKIFGKAFVLPELSNEQLSHCSQLIQAELQAEEQLSVEDFNGSVTEVLENLSKTNKPLPGLSIYEEDDEDVSKYEADYTKIVYKALAKRAMECNTKEAELAEKLKPFVEEASLLAAKTKEAWSALEKSTSDLQCYSELETLERAGSQFRLENARRELQLVTQIEAFAQQEYARKQLNQA